MRYEQLKHGSIFADKVGIYIRTNFGVAVNLKTGKPAQFHSRESIKKRCCATCYYYRRDNCTNGDTRECGLVKGRFDKCDKWEELL